jgi:uncharacterized protein (TIGR03790 family)
MHADNTERKLYRSASACICGLLFAAQIATAQGPENVLVVVNADSPLSRQIGEYYAQRRNIPADHICRIHSSAEETVTRALYTRDVAGPIAAFLRRSRLTEKILYMVTTQGVPLRIKNESGSAMSVDGASVDSELTLLYSDMHSGKPHATTGSLPNPYFGKTTESFSHPAFPIYLVTRLAAYDFDGVKGLIDRALQASNRGKFVIDLKSPGDGEGDNWLRDAGVHLAAMHLPDSRLVVDQSTSVVYDQSDVIGYASWGSNDGNRHRRFLGFHWLPGAIMTEYVSTNARTFTRPPESWTIGDWNSPRNFFFGSPQTMTGDYIQEGVTGASGHTDEPYLIMNPRPDYLLPAYYSGRNLADSYYLSIRGLSWQNVVIGDPLCSIGKP